MRLQLVVLPQRKNFNFMNVDYNINKEIKEYYIECGTKFRVEFTSYTHEGLAVAHIDGKTRKNEEYTNFPLFVFGGLIGEKAVVRITKMNKTYAYAEIISNNENYYNKERVKPICPMFGQCGGCNIMHMSYKAQLSFKENMVKETLERVGKLSNVEVLPILGMKNEPYYYRNKVQVPVQSFKDKTTCGFYKRDTHDVIPLNECFIQSTLSTEIVKFTKNVLTECKAKGYNEKTGNGDIKHILVRKNYDETEIMIVIVSKVVDLLKKSDMDLVIKKITGRYKAVKSIILNVNPLNTNTILGDKCITLYGKDYIQDQLCGLKFKIGAKSFYQVNHDQCEVLYNTAIDFAALTSEDVVIDAYCGIGTIGLIASSKVKKVYAVEVVDEAIKCANENASLNKIENIEFVCNKAETQIVRWMNEKIKPTTIFVDPPRKGLDETMIKTICDMQISKIVYVSCDPATLARDLEKFVTNGYVINKVQPVDMFCQTNHVETIVMLIKK